MGDLVRRATLENLRRCAELLSATAEDMDVQSMEFDELDAGLEITRQMEQSVQKMTDNLTVAQWQHPDKMCFIHDPPLYCAKEVAAVVAHLQEVCGVLPAAWRGYLYTLREEKQSYVMRAFADGARDVVPADQAHTAPIQTCTLFDDRDIMEKTAKINEMTVFRCLTTQTSEPTYAAVALCFL